MTTDNTSVLKNLLLLFLIFAGLYFAKPFLVPLAIGGILATLFLPFCRWMEKNKVPKAIAAFICLLTLVLAAAAILSLAGWQVNALMEDLELVKQKVFEILNSVENYIFTKSGIPAEKQSQLLKEQGSSFIGSLQTVAGSLISVFTNAVLVLAYVFLLLYYRGHIRLFLLKLAPPGMREEAEQVVKGAAHVSQQYMVGLSKMIACLWIMYSIGFGIAGVKNFLFFAILCGLLEIVPFLGNLTGSTLTLLVSAVQGASPGQLGAIALTYGAVQFIQGWVLEPVILGPQVKINPLFTIVALVAGELVWGIPGILLAIPLTAILKIVCDHIEPLKPYGFLIGEIKTAKDDPAFIKKMKSRIKRKPRDNY